MAEFGLQDAKKFFTQQGQKFFDGAPGKDLVQAFGVLRLPKTSNEAQQCSAILNILRDYSKRKKPPRPLSVAVFGPPGSGKSLTVKQLFKEAGGIIENLHEINLSQMNDPEELSRALRHIFPESKPSKSSKPAVGANLTPLVFFDEFDSALKGEPLGWLRWFLAPMQDGFLLCEGKPIKFGKAIFIFAGGTADTYQDFQERHADYFVQRKGPDFVSRLRGFLNIEGLNKYGSERILRRALVLHHQLGNRSESLKSKNDTRKIDPDLLSRLLAGAHYIHGARSLEALLDMCTLTELGDEKFDEEHLPPRELMQLHVSRGALDGLTVGVSAGQDASSNEFIEKLATTLFERGAKVAHGGELLIASPLKAMVEKLQSLPKELVERTEKRIVNFLPHPSYLRPEVTKSQQEYDEFVQFEEMHSIAPSEFEELHLKDKEWFKATDNVESKLAWALSLFRMRLRLAQEIDVLVVVGGKTTDGWGRFPGVVEEVMLALAFHRPVYILGMTNGEDGKVGAAKAIGHSLGLSGIQHTVSEFLLDPSGTESASFRGLLQHWSSRFAVPAKPGLPMTFEDLRKYLRDHAIGTDNWPDNGLSEKENRKVFDANNDSASREMCVELIVKGISRLLAKGLLQP